MYALTDNAKYAKYVWMQPKFLKCQTAKFGKSAERY